MVKTAHILQIALLWTGALSPASLRSFAQPANAETNRSVVSFVSTSCGICRESFKSGAFEQVMTEARNKGLEPKIVLMVDNNLSPTHLNVEIAAIKATGRARITIVTPWPEQIHDKTVEVVVPSGGKHAFSDPDLSAAEETWQRGDGKPSYQMSYPYTVLRVGTKREGSSTTTLINQFKSEGGIKFLRDISANIPTSPSPTPHKLVEESKGVLSCLKSLESVTNSSLTGKSRILEEDVACELRPDKMPSGPPTNCNPYVNEFKTGYLSAFSGRKIPAPSSQHDEWPSEKSRYACSGKSKEDPAAYCCRLGFQVGMSALFKFMTDKLDDPKADPSERERRCGLKHGMIPLNHATESERKAAYCRIAFVDACSEYLSEVGSAWSKDDELVKTGRKSETDAPTCPKNFQPEDYSACGYQGLAHAMKLERDFASFQCNEFEFCPKRCDRVMKSDPPGSAPNGVTRPESTNAESAK